MKLSIDGKFRTAVRLSLVAAGLSGAIPYQVQAQDSKKDEAVELDKVEVTGSRLRRVDTETASPVYTIDRVTIESSGRLTLGDLIQDMPSISGAATNPQVNNGGGDGAACVSLRGLGCERTLTLLDGRRLGPNFDINTIPLNMVDRIEVLKEGAGAVYGSDAVGGVVNIITRKDYTGADFAVNVGNSSRADGKNYSVEGTYGVTSDKAHILLGLNYNKQEAVGAGDRKFSEHALYLYNYYGSDTIITLGSSRTPNGRISLAGTGCGTKSLTRIAGAKGTSAADYRCYTGADAYDYQPFNLVSTPQERGSIFSNASYAINDSVELFTDLYHNFTQSGFQIAPLPFDARNDKIVISSGSMYNPFGVDFGADPTDPTKVYNQFLTRFVTNGNRFSKVETTTDQITMGLRGDVPGSSWAWDAAATYQRYGQHTTTSGYVIQSALQDAVGPSVLVGGVPTCGTEASPIVGCTPINLFNLDDPATIASLNSISTAYENAFFDTVRTAELALNGNLFTWSQGTALAAVGLNYREEFLNANVDGLTESRPPDYLVCALSGETCSGDSVGQDKLWEASGEIFLPLLSEMPFAKQLNLTLGARYSHYQSFGSTTNGTAKLEWRPISDLLVRASYAEVFRAPTIFDRYGAAGTTAALFSDPCKDLTAAEASTNPNYALVCENVDTSNGDFTPENAQVTGSIVSTKDLNPETGHVFTYGVVYDPSWAKGVSATVDVWNYKIEDAITAIEPNVVASTCLNSGDAAFCDLIHRYPDGQIYYISLPVTNAGYFKTDGVDLGLKYSLPRTPFGSFRASADASYTHSFEYQLSPDQAPVEAAGTYDSAFGNYSKWRGTATLSWKLANYDAMWTTHYINGVDIAASLGDGSARPGATSPLHVGSVTYHDVVVGYTVEQTNTKLLLGVENVMDKQAPLFYQYVLNANTNVETYDTIGRFFYVRIQQSF